MSESNELYHNWQQYRKKPVVIWAFRTDEVLEISTLEGVMRANVGDYIVRGIKGEQYPVKPDIFAGTYEKVELDAE